MNISSNFSIKLPNSVVKVSQPSYTFNRYALKADTVCFSGRKVTVYDEKLKNIPNLHDPYSDIVMLTTHEYNSYINKARNCNNAESSLNLLYNYTDNLFEPERILRDSMNERLLEIKEKAPKKAKKMDLHDLIVDMYDNSRKNVNIMQQKKMSELIDCVKESDTNNKDKILSELSILQDDIGNDDFRLGQLYTNVLVIPMDKKLKKSVTKKIKEFPTNKNSADMIVVSSVNKTHKDLMKMFLEPSTTSIEHIKPQHNGGQDSLCNYMVASKKMNNMRGMMPLDEFIELYPNIPNQTQKYFDDLIEKVNEDKTNGVKIPVLSMIETAKKESKGKINVDSSRLSDELVCEEQNVSGMIEELKNRFKK